jgi:hypothetical protein
MAWQNKSLREICVHLKDVKLNGGRDLAELQEHIAKDDLVPASGFRDSIQLVGAMIR